MSVKRELTVLSIAVRDHEEIKGIAIEQQKTKLLQYTDDTTVVLSKKESAHKLFQMLDKFIKLSGLKLNRSKTEGMDRLVERSLQLCTQIKQLRK